MSDKTDALQARVTNRLIEAIENAEHGGWEKPWQTIIGAGIPTNVVTKKPYRGFNTFAFALEAADRGYVAPVWATYKQWASIGAQVRKGERGVQGIKWGATYRCDSCSHKGRNSCKAGHVNRKHMWATVFTVFNAAQVDGYEYETPDFGPEPERMEKVEAFIEATGAKIRHVAQNRAYYQSLTDQITLPLREQFDTPQGYYGTALHELTHWSGGPDRLDRKKGTIFGDQAYAAEELVAEMGAAFLAAFFGVELEPHMEHASYLASWLSVLKADPKNLYAAAKQAQEASEFLLGLAAQEAEVAA